MKNGIDLLNPSAVPDAIDADATDADSKIEIGTTHSIGPEGLHLQDLITAFGSRFNAIADQYRRSLPGRMAAMEDSALMGAADLLAVAAHQLSGCSASIGAVSVANACRDLETSCLSNDSVPSDWRERLEKIDRECAAFTALLDVML